MSSPLVVDFDGTLVDLDVDIERVRAEVVALRQSVGLSGVARPILAAISELESEDEAVGARARSVIDAAELAAAKRARILPTVPEVIELLARERRPWAVVSNNCRACVECGLERLGAEPAIVVSRDDVALPKPAPEGLLCALQRIGTPALFVGDGTADVGAARAAASRGAGVSFVAVLGPRSDAAALRAAGAESVAGTLLQALELGSGLRSRGSD